MLKGVLKPATVFESNDLFIRDDHYLVEESPARIHQIQPQRVGDGGGSMTSNPQNMSNSSSGVTPQWESDSMSSPDPLTPASPDVATAQDPLSLYSAGVTRQQNASYNQVSSLFYLLHTKFIF